MELILKAAALGCTVATVCLLLRRSNPELSMALSAAAIAVILLGALSFAGVLRDIAALVRSVSSLAGGYVEPIMKCVLISLVTKLGAELCRDSSQAAVAAAVETAGLFCALAVAAPILMSVLRLLGGIV